MKKGIYYYYYLHPASAKVSAALTFALLLMVK